MNPITSLLNNKMEITNNIYSNTNSIPDKKEEINPLLSNDEIIIKTK